jgi:drug/metabolite transporter (DMT)-like permease
MRTLKALHAGIIASAQVVEVPFFAFFILSETMSVGRVIGSVLVIAGIVLVHLSKAASARSAAEVDAGSDDVERVG